MINRIKEARLKAGLSQKELAEKMGIQSATLCGYEGGYRDPKSEGLIKIARICGVTVDYLIGFDVEKEKAPAPAKAEAKALSVDQMQNLLVQFGYIQPDQDLTDADARFLGCVIVAVNEWFRNR